MRGLRALWILVLGAGCVFEAPIHGRESFSGKGEVTEDGLQAVRLTGNEAIRWLADFSRALVCEFGDASAMPEACDRDVALGPTETALEAGWFLTRLAEETGVASIDEEVDASTLMAPLEDVAEDEAMLTLHQGLAERVRAALTDGTYVEIGRTPLSWWLGEGEQESYGDHPYIHPVAVPDSSSATGTARVAHLALEIEVLSDDQLSASLITIDVDMFQLEFDGARTSLFAPEDLQVDLALGTGLKKMWDDLNVWARSFTNRGARANYAEATRGMTGGGIRAPHAPGNLGRKVFTTTLGRDMRKDYVNARKKGKDAAAAFAKQSKQRRGIVGILKDQRPASGRLPKNKKK